MSYQSVSVKQSNRFQRIAMLGLLTALVSCVFSTENTFAADPPSHTTVLKDFKKIDGLIPLYLKGNKLYAEIASTQENKDFLVLISIARGIGQGQLLGGMSWGFGDDWIWQFKKVDDRMRVIRKNTRFKAKSGSPESSAVKQAYTDSILFSNSPSIFT